MGTKWVPGRRCRVPNRGAPRGRAGEANTDGPALPRPPWATEIVAVVAYDPAWATRGVRERDRLQHLLAPWLNGSVEHIGSTAVPGLAAKPIIDLQAPVHDLDDADHPALAHAYAELKHDLAHRYPTDREAYTAGKQRFVQDVLDPRRASAGRSVIAAMRDAMSGR